MTKAVVKKVNVLGAPKAWWAPVFQGACTLAGYPALSFFFLSLFDLASEMNAHRRTPLPLLQVTLTRGILH